MSKTYNTIYEMQGKGEKALIEMKNIKGLPSQAFDAMEEALFLLEDVMGFIAEIESAPSERDLSK